MRYALCFACLFALPAWSEDPFANVDPAFVAEFVSPRYNRESVYSTELPAGLEALALPAPFELIGSRVSERGAHIGYRAPLDPALALENALNLLLAQGWQRQVNRSTRGPGGFTIASTRTHIELCKDDSAKVLSLTSRTVENRSHLSINRYEANASCPFLRQRRRSSSYDLLSAEMPELPLPSGQGIRARSTGGGGGGDEAHSTALVTGAPVRSEILADLAEQLRRQGWDLQSDWASSVSSGSVWVKDRGLATQLVGMLHAFVLSDGAVSLRFSIHGDER